VIDHQPLVTNGQAMLVEIIVDVCFHC